MHLVDTTMFFCARGGGVRRYLLQKQSWLRANASRVRHTLLVPHPQPGIEGVETCAALGVPLGDGYRFPLSRARWRSALIQQAPDLIEAGDPYVPGWAARDAGQKLGVPVAAFFHSDLPRMLRERVGSWISRPAERYLRRLYAGFDMVFAPSRVMLQKLEAIGVSRTALQPLGVDTHIFRPEARAAALRTSLGLSADTRLLVYAGRFAKEKRLEVLLGAVERLGAPYHLALIGAERRRQISPRATALPYEPDPSRLAALLASADAFVHAGAEETFGLVLIEAMACGLPVVAVASGGLTELVQPDVGELAPRSQIPDISDAIAQLFTRDLAAAGRAARVRAERRYSWDAAFSQLLRSYARLRGEQTAPWAQPVCAQH